MPPPTDLPPLVHHLLATLLERWEQPNRQTVVRVRLSKRQHAAYYDARTAAPRQQANHLLQGWEAQGWLRLHWVKWEAGNWLEAVDLVPERVGWLYHLLGRTPLVEREEALRALLHVQQPRSPWHASFLAWAAEQLVAHRSVFPLDLSDVQNNHDLLRALDGVAALDAPTLERTLSVRLFGDSKRLAALRPALLKVLRQHAPHARAYGRDKWALLRAHHLDRVPEYLPLAGPLRLAHEGADLDITPFAPSVALSAAMLHRATVVACEASALLTVENATSFIEWLRLRPTGVLTLFIGGFASPTAITLLRQIRHHHPTLPHHHWGDLDAGGLRILAHLRQHLPPVFPLGMDVATFEQHPTHTQPLLARDRASLHSLLEQPLLADCFPLIHHLLHTGRKLEQEAINPASLVMPLTG